MPKHVAAAPQKKLQRHVQALLGNTIVTVMACAGLALLLGAMTVGATRFVAQTPKPPIQAPAPPPAQTAAVEPPAQPAKPAQAPVEQTAPAPAPAAPTPEVAPTHRHGSNRSQRAIEVLTPKPHSPLETTMHDTSLAPEVTLQASTPLAGIDLKTDSLRISIGIATPLELTFQR